MDELSRRDVAKVAVAGAVAAGLAGAAAARQPAGGGERGSDRMLDELLGQRPPAIDRGELRKLVAAVLDKKEVKLVDWWWKGQPAIDAVVGQLSVAPKALGEVIRDVYAGKLWPQVRVFPKGIPVPIDYLVEVRLGEAAHQG